MKKRLLMISTFLLSFIILITNVNAAQELTCAYGDGGWTQKPVKLVQNKDGTLFKYTASHGTYLGITETKWEKFDVKITNFKYKSEESDKYSSDFLDENGNLSSCPSCLNYATAGADKIEAYNKVKDKCDTGFVPLDDSKNEALTEEKTIEKTSQEVKQKMQEYQMNYCKYVLYTDTNATYVDKDITKIVELYYNENSFNFTEGYTTKFTANDIISKNEGSCPEKIYSYYNDLVPDQEMFYVNSKEKPSPNRTWILTGQQNYSSSPSDNQVPTTDDACQLLGDDTIKLIDDIMRIIRIIVPLLLIVLGMTDFLRATFSDNEDNMKKDRERFIKRIIAAIIVFIVPMFVHLVLNVANSVWIDISPETCIK